MKMELPFAILLLAVGGVLWITQMVPSNAQNAVSETSLIAETDERAHGDYPNAGIPVEFSDLPAIDTVAFEENEDALIRNFRFPSFAPSEDQPAAIVAKAASYLENSVPISCKARIVANLFDQVVEGNGQYLHAGQGSGKTRLDLEFPIDQKNSMYWNHICDGKFLYWIETLGNERSIEFVDMSELASFGQNPEASPVKWLSRSGTTSLLRNLSAAFDFDTPEKHVVGGIEMVRLHGRWKADALANILSRSVTNEENEIEWEQLPPQMPHTVELLLGNDEFFPLFPYRVVFYKIGESNQPKPMLTMEFFQVQKLAEIPEDYFRVNAANSKQSDLSDDYRERIEHLVEAAAIKNTVER